MSVLHKLGFFQFQADYKSFLNYSALSKISQIVWFNPLNT